ncbi:MAG: PKD domain-containing protein, partial [Candidatus Dormibacteraeota bacterium]|nr:PKD domain-containing protein [Candidatus Dormibacteraeota bacterium]
CTFYGSGPALSDCPARIQNNQTAIVPFHQETLNSIENTYEELGQVYQGQPMPLADYPANVAYPTDCITAADTNNVTEVNCADTFQDWQSDQQYFLAVDDNSGGTDQDPFVRCGVPAWGLFGAWDNSPQEPLQNNPTGNIDVPYAGYDTPVDNMAWLNALASGKPAPATGADVSPPNEIDPWNSATNPGGKIGSEALRRGLAFAADLTINQATDPQMAGAAPRPTDPIAYFSADRYAETAGTADTFTAIPSPVAASTWNWTFDDGASASGPTASHAFVTPGVHTVTLTETAPSGTSTYSASVNVVAATGDPNTQCGTPSGMQTAAAFTPTFSNSIAQTVVPEAPWVPTLLAVAGAVGCLEVVRRRQRSRS